MSCFALVNVYLTENDMKLNRELLIDATIINTPSSTNNKEKSHDPDMHQTSKGNQWYFDMKAHIVVGSKTKLIHSIAVTPANIHDSQVLEDLLHGNETRVRGDSAYAGQKDKLTKHAPKAKDFTQKKACRNRRLTGQEPSANRECTPANAFTCGHLN
ncbi:transposase [Candidatus Vondammii sp. HM_W22]|uniref:transposase n=1 Tax=Candidatus Vondammii sp. HM_W22 TaxID=2687299 RepID=UPI001F13F916|nr:transposase [Candidatus Vondammii sp. HM_W22]